MTARKRLVVIGHGMVGQKLVETLVARDALGAWDITVVGEEVHPAYDRVHLSKLFEGSTPSALTLGEPATGVTYVHGDAVAGLDLAARVVTTRSGRSIGYDRAVLATGSSAFVPPVAGREAAGCFTYRTIDDVDAIRSWAAGRAHGVVVGGGLLGLEAASALRSCGLATEVVELAPWLMPAQVDEEGGALLIRRIRDLGVAVHPATSISAIEAGPDGAVQAVMLAPAGDPGGAERMQTEMVVFAAGIRPRDDLARSAGLEVGSRGGIVVDERCRTSDPSVHAIGECALAMGQVFGLVGPGYEMARVAAEDLLGGESVFGGRIPPTKLKLLGVDVASFGDSHARTPGAATITFTDRTTAVHKRLVTDEKGRLIGGVLVGDISGFDTMAAIASGDVDAPAELADLLIGTRPGTDTGAVTTGGAVALRPTATICSCENISKGVICEAAEAAIVATGSVDVAAIKQATRAGTGCGGCGPQLQELVQAALAAHGIENAPRLCEHFEHSRQELFDLIRLSRATSFAQAIDRFGQGAGCEICKPTVASILASIVGTHILDGDGAAIQDSNDHFLANLQRDGTYSVVPRVPGGEIAPEKLIVLGEVARDFGLYVKITGGQRVDLLGARMDDLPRIWARLVDAGFESGHAYGKAVRTVKSCVGTTWCRFGVQDSTTLAIDLELRYRGLRSPHKLKMAVSGCARECAEAQGKDVGVIATERGWNLYVAGNGGTRPRHADLLASDLDRETLIRYIDRFVMYYVRTADRLQRTSSWLDSLEGGIEHVRRVVVEDSLGMGAEFEADMARHVERYRCEWKETLEDPVRLRRFRTFVNTDAPDPDIVMTEERGQPVPALAGGGRP